MTTKPKVGIIFLTYNAKSILGDVLNKAILSALNQDYENLEIIIVDNGSTDGTWKYIRDKYRGRAKVVRLGKNYGYCLGNNIATRYLSRDVKFILFQNSDVILSKDYVRKLVDVMKRDPSIVAMQGVEVSPSGDCKLGDSVNVVGYFVKLRCSDNLQSLEVLFGSVQRY